MMPVRDPAAFQEHFKNLNDPRVERTRKHPLINIVFIAVCGVLSGANSFAAIEEFGLDRRTWFARFLDLTNGVPSDDTFARVLARLDPGAFERCLLSWIRAVQEVTENRLIAIDGKTLRGSYDRRGDYVLAVKQNQPTLYEQVEEAVGAGLEQDASDLDEHQTVEVGHGRQETRTYVVFPAPETVDPDGAWRDLSAVGMAITESTDAQGRCRLEVRYYILSALLSAARFAGAVRGHWSIENNLHWQLDVSFREDQCRVRTDNAPANLSVIRRFALGLLKRETSCRRGIETKRLKCAASDAYREKALFNT